ncbi:hypothetical protein AKO1_010387 [Acrasis kona]|uniref:23S rRNA (Uracil(747)-C(5))-methyltransferase RlmC n=1 Tax=Acrasis kona TaxID=1008807 RepID=A0AAW2YL43_9EUKA
MNLNYMGLALALMTFCVLADINTTSITDGVYDKSKNLKTIRRSFKARSLPEVSRSNEYMDIGMLSGNDMRSIAYLQVSLDDLLSKGDAVHRAEVVYFARADKHPAVVTCTLTQGDVDIENITSQSQPHLTSLTSSSLVPTGLAHVRTEIDASINYETISVEMTSNYPVFIEKDSMYIELLVARQPDPWISEPGNMWTVVGLAVGFGLICATASIMVIVAILCIIYIKRRNFKKRLQVMPLPTPLEYYE